MVTTRAPTKTRTHTIADVDYRNISIQCELRFHDEGSSVECEWVGDTEATEEVTPCLDAVAPPLLMPLRVRVPVPEAVGVADGVTVLLGTLLLVTMALGVTGALFDGVEVVVVATVAVAVAGAVQRASPTATISA